MPQWLSFLSYKIQFWVLKDQNISLFWLYNLQKKMVLFMANLSDCIAYDVLKQSSKYEHYFIPSIY